MKKICLIFAILFMFCNVSIASELQKDDVLASKLHQIGFFRKQEKAPEIQLQENMQKIGNYLSKRNLKRLKTLYSTSFVTNDGFDFATYFEMLEKTFEVYPKLDFCFKIKTIEVNGEFAQVLCEETSSGQINPSKLINQGGVINSKSLVFYHFKKVGENWLVSSYDVVSENAIIQYGDAVNFKYKLIAPKMVKAGENYTVRFELTQNPNFIQVASITNEPIVYPPIEPDEIFKNTKSNNALERVVTANKNGKNENAVASVGISRLDASLIDPSKVNISGLAFLVSRVNVVKTGSPIEQNSK